MNRYQKLAWFNLIVITATIIITTTAIAIEIHWRGYSTIAPGFFVILLLLKLNPFLFKKPKGQSKVVSDERDEFIVKRAVSFAYIAFWFVFFVSSFAVHIFKGMGPDSSVPTITLPLIAVGGALFIKIVSSIAILVQYGRAGKGEES
ncbi:MAG: hypothetical protein ACYSU3_19655 [Planctomycetota bacterium]|jgi:hypothetical protein